MSSVAAAVRTEDPMGYKTYLPDASLRLLDAYAAGIRKGYDGDALRPNGRHENQRDYLGLSSAGDCRRKQWFLFSREHQPEPFTDETLALFMDGHLLEEDTRMRLRASGHLSVSHEAFELVHPADDRIRGHVDGFLTFFLSGPYLVSLPYLFEHKAMRDFPFSKLIGGRRGAPPENVEVEHEVGYILTTGTVQRTNLQYWAQVQAYMIVRLMSAMQHEKVDLGDQRTLFVARHKETGKLAVEEIVSDYEAGAQIVSRMRVVLADYDVNTLSDRDYNPVSDWQCKYCSFATACRNADANSVPVVEEMAGAGR